MKRFSLYCVLSSLFFCFLLNANPLPEAQAIISEFMFDTSGHWILEVGFADYSGYHSLEFDSILVSSKSGISRVRLEGLPEMTTLFVITSDSLVTPLTIDPQGDRIVIHSFVSYLPSSMSLDDSLVFGTLPGSMFDAIQPGFSVTRLPDGGPLVKSRIATIGAPNDTTGTLGTLRGRIFDSRDREVHAGVLLLEYPIFFLPDGTYTTRLFSRTQSFTYLEKMVNQGSNVLPTQPFTVTMEPDSTIDQDIHLLVEDPYGIREGTPKNDEKLSLIPYPNPFNSSTNFSIAIPQSVPFRSGVIEIFNIAGQKISDIAVRGNSTVRWNGTNSRGEIQSTGVYLYRLVLDHRTVKEGSVILLK